MHFGPVIAIILWLSFIAGHLIFTLAVVFPLSGLLGESHPGCLYQTSFKLLLSLTFILALLGSALTLRLINRFRRNNPELPLLRASIPGSFFSLPRFGAQGSFPDTLHRGGFWLVTLLILPISLFVISSEIMVYSYKLFPAEESYREMVAFMEPCFGSLLDRSGIYITVGVIGPMVEELFFRGYIFAGLLSFYRHRQRSVLWPLLYQAIFFGLAHITNPFQVFYSLVAGVVLGALFLKSGSLWLPILVHIIFNSLQILLLDLLPGELIFTTTVPEEIEHIPVPLLASAMVLFTLAALYIHELFRGGYFRPRTHL